MAIDSSTRSITPSPPPPSAYTESWEPQLAERIQQEVEKKQDHEVPFMVAVCGVPGSGKTISVLLLATLLEERYGIATMACPMDGYHYPLEYLKTFPDAEDAIYRRGAPDTFDPQALLRDLDRIRNNKEEEFITVPGFDHAKGDPEPDKHAFDRQKHQVVLCEGLYLLHDQDGWEEVASVFDLTIFMDSDVDNCIERVKIRNRCIPGYTPDEIEIRCEEVDRVNAMTVLQSKGRADVTVESCVTAPQQEIEFPSRMLPTLSSLALKDMDEADTNENADWTMDISSRPRSESHVSLARNDSFLSNKSEPPPPAASLFVGTWEPEMAERIGQQVKTADRFPFMVALVGGKRLVSQAYACVFILSN